MLTDMNTLWAIDHLRSYPQEAGFNNVVVAVIFHVDGELGGATASVPDVAFVKLNPESFIPYNELTPEIVLGWVKESLGATGISRIESDLLSFLTAKPKETAILPLPWK